MQPLLLSPNPQKGPGTRICQRELKTHPRDRIGASMNRCLCAKSLSARNGCRLGLHKGGAVGVRKIYRAQVAIASIEPPLLQSEFIEPSAAPWAPGNQGRSE